MLHPLHHACRTHTRQRRDRIRIIQFLDQPNHLGKVVAVQRFWWCPIEKRIGQKQFKHAGFHRPNACPVPRPGPSVTPTAPASDHPPVHWPARYQRPATPLALPARQRMNPHRSDYQHHPNLENIPARHYRSTWHRQNERTVPAVHLHPPSPHHRYENPRPLAGQSLRQATRPPPATYRDRVAHVPESDRENPIRSTSSNSASTSAWANVTNSTAASTSSPCQWPSASRNVARSASE